VAEAVKRTTGKANGATGGEAIFAVWGSRILRDAQAAQFHLMRAKKRHHFTGRLAIDLDPVAQ